MTVDETVPIDSRFIEGKSSFRTLVLGCTVSKSTTLSGGEAFNSYGQGI
jgi:hypothetical protein